MLTAEWNKDMLSREKKVVEEEISEGGGSSYTTRTKNRCLNRLSTKNILGTRSGLAKLSLKKVLEGRRRLLGGKKYLTVAGNFNDADLAPLIAALEKLDGGPSEPKYEKAEFESLYIKSAGYNYINLSFVFAAQANSIMSRRYIPGKVGLFSILSTV